jgi:hypothetical protein
MKNRKRSNAISEENEKPVPAIQGGTCGPEKKDRGKADAELQ